MKSFLISLFLFPLFAAAQLRVAAVFSDNMVLQRDQPVHLWGKHIPGKKVTVKFAGIQKQTIVKNDSSWSVFFPSQKANADPQSVSVSSSNGKIELKNILIGDVWICSGQSNMEWAMRKEMHWNDEKVHTNNPLIRFLNPPPAGRYVYNEKYKDSLLRRLNKDSFYLWNGWKVCDNVSIQPMSAVAYYFAKAVTASEQIPIGLINLSIGGAPIETFISTDALKNNPAFSSKMNGNWLYNSSLPNWIRERGRQNVEGVADVPTDEYGPAHAYKPGFAFESGIKPLLSFPIKGMLWYQGESNAEEIERVAEYNSLVKLMVEAYRKQWKQPSMPFYFVQLSSIERPLWPQFRDEQRKELNEIPHTGMAVCSDIGAKNDVHPTNKKDVGERLARWALLNDYHKKIIPSGPLPVKAVYKNGVVEIKFQYADGMKTSDGKELRGFSVDGNNPAAAIISNNKVVISAQQKPAFVYYGWQPFTDANLVNAEGLPASTFKLEISQDNTK